MALANRKKGKEPRQVERLEAEPFISEMKEERKDLALRVVLGTQVVLTAVVVLQALGFAYLEPKPFYAIVVGLVTTMTYTIRKIFSRN